MSEQVDYEIAEGINIFRSSAVGAPVEHNMGELKKIRNLPGVSWNIFETTPENQTAGKGKMYGRGLFPDGKEMTFAVCASASEEAWALGDEEGTYDFEYRYKGGVVFAFTGVVKDIQDVIEDDHILTDITLKPSGGIDRAPAPD
jgi:hypothetical protein